MNNQRYYNHRNNIISPWKYALYSDTDMNFNNLINLSFDGIN